MKTDNIEHIQPDVSKMSKCSVCGGPMIQGELLSAVSHGICFGLAHQECIDIEEEELEETKCICQGFYQPNHCPVHGRK